MCPHRFDASNPSLARALVCALTLPSKSEGQPVHFHTLGFLVTQGSSVFAEISTSLPDKTLWIDFKTQFGNWLETSSNSGFCD